MTQWLHEFIQQIIDFAGSNPMLVGLVLCVAAGAEAIIVIGALFPGEALVLGVAAAAGAAGLDLLPMIIWTTLGAVAGDGISYWIGHSKGEDISNWPWLKKRPQLLAQGENFIARHGIKSILIARFLPALRAIVPVAAGVLGMPPKRFYIANFVSATGWAIVHILPAAGLGLAWNTLGAVSGRLAVLVALLLIMLFVVIRLTRLLVNRGMPLLARLYEKAIRHLSEMRWRPAGVLAAWLDPDQPRLAGMAFWVALLLAGMFGFAGVLEDLVSGDPLVRADTAINHLIQGLRTRPADAIMVVITSLGDSVSLMAAVATLIGLLFLQRAWRLAAAVALTVGAAMAFVPIIKQILHKPRPIDIYTGAHNYSFPSGHTTLSAVVFGVFAVVVAHKLSIRGRGIVYALAGLWVTLVGLSRIYLSAHWPSDVLGGMLFGTMLTAAFALLIGHTDLKNCRCSLMAAAVLAVFIGFGGFHAWKNFNGNMLRYEPRKVVKRISLAKWKREGWRALPQRRIDLDGDHGEPLALQWAGSTAELGERMRALGWRKVPAFTWRDGLKLLLPRATLKDLLPLPVMHNGRFPVATFVRQRNEKAGRFVLRLWRSGTLVKRPDGVAPLLLASLRREIVVHPFGLATAPRQGDVEPEVTIGLVENMKSHGVMIYESTAPNKQPLFPVLAWPGG